MTYSCDMLSLALARAFLPLTAFAILHVLNFTYFAFLLFWEPDQVVMHEMKILNADSYGIYYDFCDIVFKLPESQDVTKYLDRVRRMNSK